MRQFAEMKMIYWKMAGMGGTWREGHFDTGFGVKK